MYKTDSAGNIIKNVYAINPSIPLNMQKIIMMLLHGMVEEQMRFAIEETANFWYTARVNAGRPDLTNLDSAETDCTE